MLTINKKMMELISALFYIFIISANLYIYKFIKSLESQPNCPANWKSTNLRLLSQLGICIGIINLFMPCNTTLYKIPIIGTGFSLLILLITVMQILTLYWFCKELTTDYKDKCVLDRYTNFTKKINEMSFKYIFWIAIGISIALLYL
jgi:hypothetical protein